MIFVDRVMKISFYVIVLCSALLAPACRHADQPNGEAPTEVRDVIISSTVEEDDLIPPLPGFTSRFKTLDKWLIHVCEHEKPPTSIATYEFVLFEGHELLLGLTGTNTYKSPELTSIKIEFEPREQFFRLPDAEYMDLGQDQLYGRLTAQLKAFTQTDLFRHSFFQQAETIKTDWGGVIWSR